MDGKFYVRLSEYYGTIPDEINEIKQIAAEIKINNSVATVLIGALIVLVLKK